MILLAVFKCSALVVVFAFVTIHLGYLAQGWESLGSLNYIENRQIFIDCFLKLIWNGNNGVFSVEEGRWWFLGPSAPWTALLEQILHHQNNIITWQNWHVIHFKPGCHIYLVCIWPMRLSIMYLSACMFTRNDFTGAQPVGLQKKVNKKQSQFRLHLCIWQTL